MSESALVADARDPTAWYTGLGLVQDATEISNGISDHSWVDVTLGGVGGGLDLLAAGIDPLGTLMAWGVGWLLEHVEPLRDTLDWLAGNPAEVAAHAATWQNVSTSTTGAHQRFASSVRTQTADWRGDAADAYRAHATEQLAALDGIATVTKAISYAVEGAGLLVGLVREIVRDLIAQFVATLAVRLPQWLAAEGLTVGLATPVVVGQVATLVAKWINRIQHFILGELAGILHRLQQLLGRLSRTDPVRVPGWRSHASRERPETGLFREGDGIVRNGKKLLMSSENVLAVAGKYGINMEGVRFSVDKLRRGSGPGREFYGVTTPDGEIKLARDAFVDEEQLARTLAHERFHLDELRNGMDFPWNEADRAASEVRAYAYEERWWQSMKHLIDRE
ncbi:WXG100 family type VII secretion target [Actinoplanes sp. GCM10030250]|uniref:WXG100 family type VII secretion target n=1 Tax=Actinoplanes sp. GCM10030250 TaxID=3273376 RepID=UPI00360C09CA